MEMLKFLSELLVRKLYTSRTLKVDRQTQQWFYFAHRKHVPCVIKSGQLMLLREITAVSSQNYTKFRACTKHTVL
jgi:hypothetical protein